MITFALVSLYYTKQAADDARCQQLRLARLQYCEALAPAQLQQFPACENIIAKAAEAARQSNWQCMCLSGCKYSVQVFDQTTCSWAAYTTTIDVCGLDTWELRHGTYESGWWEFLNPPFKSYSYIFNNLRPILWQHKGAFQLARGH